MLVLLQSTRTSGSGDKKQPT